MGFAPGLAVTGDLTDLGVSKDRSVKSRCLFRLMIEPQTRRDLLDMWHEFSPSGVSSLLSDREWQ
jgi:hypothetical protein